MPSPAPDQSLPELRALAAEDRVELAVTRLRRFLRAHPNETEGWTLLGACLLRARQPEEALEAADRAVGLDRGWASGWDLRARALIDLGQHRPAGMSAAEATRLEPMVAAYQITHGRALLGLGEVGEARRVGELARRLAPEEVDGHLLVAQAAARAADWAAADTALDGAEAAGASVGGGIAADRRIDRLRSAVAEGRRLRPEPRTGRFARLFGRRSRRDP